MVCCPARLLAKTLHTHDIVLDAYRGRERRVIHCVQLSCDLFSVSYCIWDGGCLFSDGIKVALGQIGYILGGSDSVRFVFILHTVITAIDSSWARSSGTMA